MRLLNGLIGVEDGFKIDYIRSNISLKHDGLDCTVIYSLGEVVYGDSYFHALLDDLGITHSLVKIGCGEVLELEEDGVLYTMRFEPIPNRQMVGSDEYVYLLNTLAIK